MSDYPRLRIHATGPGPSDIDEITLDGQVLHALSIKLEVSGNDLTRATIEMLVVPDIDVPAGIL